MSKEKKLLPEGVTYCKHAPYLGPKGHLPGVSSDMSSQNLSVSADIAPLDSQQTNDAYAGETVPGTGFVPESKTA